MGWGASSGLLPPLGKRSPSLGKDWVGSTWWPSEQQGAKCGLIDCVREREWTEKLDAWAAYWT